MKAREIKFRAWDMINKKMESGYVLGKYHFGEVVSWNPPQINYYSLIDENFKIMQYTGLKDKNGKEIYEGNIVKNGYGRICVIWWSILSAGFLAVWVEDYKKIIIKDPKTSSGNPVGIDKLSGIGSNIPYEIIGNIYENPELIEEVK